MNAPRSTSSSSGTQLIARRTSSLLSTLSEIKDLNLSGRLSYENAKFIDWGGYGDISIGTCDIDSRSKVKVAIKRIRIHALGDRDVNKLIGKEIKIWSSVKHNNILPLVGYIIDEYGLPCLVSEFMFNGTVLSYALLHPELDVMHMILGIAKGMHYLHRKRIIHSDLKSDNILVSESGKPLICDFGISRMISISQSMSGKCIRDQSSTLRGSSRWMSPELLIPPEGEHVGHTRRSDVWAFGMTTYELLSKKRPYYQCTSEPQVISAIMHNKLPDKPDKFDEWPAPFRDIWDLCEECWSKDSAKRPRTGDIVRRIEILALRLASQTCGTISLPTVIASGFNRRDALRALLSSEEMYAKELVIAKNAYTSLVSATTDLCSSDFQDSSSPESTFTLAYDDILAIFETITELAEISDTFLKKLQEKLGNTAGDLVAESSIGPLFLDLLSRMKPVYSRYISNHVHTLRHLDSFLQQTPMLASFLEEAESLVSSKTNTWNLHSLSLKPAQRHLKYATLLTVIVEQTPDNHVDNEYLTRARDAIEELTQFAKDGKNLSYARIPPVSPKDESHSLSSPSGTSPSTIPPPSQLARPSLPQPPKFVPSFNAPFNMYTCRDTMATLRMDKLESFADRRKSAVSSSAALEQRSLNAPVMPATPATESLVCDTFLLSDEKPLPVPPADDNLSNSPAPMSSLSILESEGSMEAIRASSETVVTKREHALKDLLSSERSYSSDLAFIQNVHIPMALGKQAPFHLPTPPTPPNPSGSLSRTLFKSPASFSSSSHLGPPMTSDDVRTIFGNIIELAMFSELFSDRLQEALGDVLEDGKGEDWVGALFLEIVPQMEPPYMHYITKHPNALKHLNSLPRAPALTSYLAQTQHLSSSVTHAWDLPSLLIKPVQRLLNYSLLLSTIIEHTPNDHGDKENLKMARDRMEALARDVNRTLRQISVVNEVLREKTHVRKPSSFQKKLRSHKTVLVGVGRMKNIGMGLRTSRPKVEDSHGESARVTELEAQLRKCEAFVREFAKDIVNWAQTVRASQMHLRAWAIDFGKTIGISEDQPSEAFKAFIDVIDPKLMPLCQLLDDLVAKELLPELADLHESTKSPLKLLSVWHAWEPHDNKSMAANNSQNRPSEASQKYLDLRRQLASDLPKYLELFDKGVVMCIRRFARRQIEFWSSVRDEWGTLWEYLRIEGEANAGCVETLALWWARYSEVEEAMSKLNVLRRERPFLNHVRSRTSDTPNSFDTCSIDYSSPYLTPFPSSAFTGSSSGNRSFGSLDSTIPRNLHSSPSTKGVHHLSTFSASPLGKKSRSNVDPFPSSGSQHSLNTINTINTYATYSPYDGSEDYAESTDSRNDVQRRIVYELESRSRRRFKEALRASPRNPPSQKSDVS